MNERTFRYLEDPIFLTAFALYWINRWVLKPMRKPVRQVFRLRPGNNKA